MIFANIAYCPREVGDGFDIGYAYNEFMERLRLEDWAVFLDHDAAFTTFGWYRQIEEAIEQRAGGGGFGALTGVTNRVGCKWQIARESDPDNHDMRYHRVIGAARAVRHGSKIEDVTDSAPMSGVLMVLSKIAWDAGAKFERGFLGVDNSLHLALRKAKLRLGLMPGLYAYHWYRGDGSASHLPKDRKAKTAKSFRNFKGW